MVINMKIILASQSPRRRELLARMGIEFEVKVSDADENITDTDPDRVVMELSMLKARAVYDSLFENGSSAGEGESIFPSGNLGNADKIMVIGADTIVSCDGQILGKPKDEEDAFRMLKMLQGRSHQVFTGVAVLVAAVDGIAHDGKELLSSRSFYEKTDVTFYKMSDDEIRDYIASKEPMDKAGAYGIQGLCARYISGINGDYSNVVGLPVGRLYQEIKSWLQE